jgi:hypothetical protein
MRKGIALVLYLLFFSFSNAQSKIKYENYIACNDKEGRRPYYECLLTASEKLDELVNVKYKCILRYLDKQVLDCSKMNCGKEELEFYTTQKNNFIASQKKWAELQSTNSNFYWDIRIISNVNYVKSLIKDSLDRLKYLDQLIEHEGEGSNEILKCR